MSETPESPNKTNSKKFEGEGMSFKGKLIGMEDLSIDRDEKICLDSMFKLKAVVRARGEHKQKIQLNLTMSAVRIIDETTKVVVASHDIERISFVVIDPRDPRAFGYIFNTANDRHQFWAIKTERSAAASVVALKELFEVAFEQFTNAEKEKLKANKPKPEAPSPTNEPVTTQESSPVTTDPVPTPVTTSSPMDEEILIDSTIPTTSALINGDLWDMEAPPIPVKPAAPKIVDPLEEIFGDLPTTQVLPPTNPPPPVPSSANPFSNFPPPSQTNPFSATPQQTFTSRPAPLASQQPNLLAPRSFSPITSPSVTNPFSEFDILADLSSGPAGRPTKESFFPPGPPPKTIQQLQMEKQLYPFTSS